MPVGCRAAIDAENIVGLVEDVIGILAQPLFILRQVGKIAEVLEQPRLDFVGESGDFRPAVQNGKAPGLQA